MSEWHKKRAGGIGGSEIAAVVGCHPFLSAVELYERKVNPETAPDAEDSVDLRRGRIMGPFIADWYEEQTGLVVTHSGRHEKTLRHPRFTRLWVTPDGRIRKTRDSRPIKAFEGKCPRRDDKYGEPGTDDVPRHVLIQAQCEAAVLDVESTDVAVFVYGELRVYSVPFDAELFGSLIEQMQKFWTDHVEAKVPPGVDGSASAREWLRVQYPESAGEILDSSPEINGIVSRYRAARNMREMSEGREKLHRAQLEQAIGAHSGLRGDWGSISFKYTKPRSGVAWKALCEEMQPDPELVAKYTNTKPGARVFRPKFKKEPT